MALHRYLARIILYVLCFLAPLSRAKVYVNRLWDEDYKEFRTKSFYREGESVMFNRGYQNAYGEENDLEPGPPFIIEHNVTLRNTYDSDGNVDQFGILKFESGGAAGLGNEPFVITCIPPDDFTHPTLRASGGVAFVGSTLDPITLKGIYELVVGLDNQKSAREGDGPEYIWSNTNFQGLFDSNYHNSSPLQIRGAHLSINNCNFAYSDPGFTIPFSFADVGVHASDCTAIWDVKLINCRFENLFPLDAAVRLSYLRSVTIEGCHFKDIFVEQPVSGMGVVRIQGSGLKSIHKNTVSNCTTPAIVSRGSWCAVGTSRIKTNEALPLVSTSLHVDSGSELTIKPGSLLKLMGGFLVDGQLRIEDAVLTSHNDDAYGPDIDFTTAGSFTYWTNGQSAILVDTTGTLAISNSTLRYAGGLIETHGSLQIENSTFERFKGGGVVIRAAKDKGYRIVGSTMRHFESGNAVVYYENSSGAPAQLLLDSVDLLENNLSGLSVGYLKNSPTRITVRSSRIIGNGGHGISCPADPSLIMLTVENSVIAANRNDALECSDLQGDSALIFLHGNVVWGNGGGITIANGTPSVISNTISCNAGRGLSIVGADGFEKEAVANNIFYRNTDAGYHDGNAADPFLAHNIFHENGEGPLLYRHGDTWIYTVKELRELGDGFASNAATEPGFTLPRTGQVGSFRYDDDTNLSALLDASHPFASPRLSGQFICPDTSRRGARWYHISHVSQETLYVFGNVSDYTETDAPYRIHGFHLRDNSPLIDAGVDSLVGWAFDVEGDSRRIDGNEDGVDRVDIGADEFNPDAGHESPIEITSPSRKDFFRAGDTCIIQWDSDTISRLRILFSETYNPTRPYWDTIAADVEGPAGKFRWKVPPAVSNKCVIRVESASRSWLFDHSGPFTIKRWILTRLDTDGHLREFLRLCDSWRFGNGVKNMWPASWYNQFNYAGGEDPFTGEPYPMQFWHPLMIDAKPADFPDWPSFVRAFGVQQCYHEIEGKRYYRLPAVAWWWNITRAWNGSCYGFGTSTSLAFFNKQKFLADYPTVGDFVCLHDLDTSGARRNVITQLHTHQFGVRHLDHFASSMTKTPRETLAELKEVMGDNVVNGPLLAIGNNSDSIGGGHVLSPVELKRSPSDPERFLLYVYDSNHPAVQGAHHVDTVVLDSAANTWAYDDFPEWSDSLGFCFLMDSTTSYLRPPLLPHPRREERPRIAMGAAGRISVFQRGATDIVLKNNDGDRIGHQGTRVWRDIVDAAAYLALTGHGSAPYGYSLPRERYTCTLRSGTDSTVTVSIHDSLNIFRCTRNGVTPAQTDKLIWDDALTVSNPDSALKRFHLSCLYQGKKQDRWCFVKGLSLLKDEKVVFSSPDGKAFNLRDRGTGQTVELGFWAVGKGGSVRVQTEKVKLPADAEGSVAPQWEKPYLGDVKWMLDRNNDGVWEDTTIVSVVTGVDNTRRQPPHPYRFTVMQLGPPGSGRMLRLLYNVPTACDVVIDVLNARGQRVTTLVDEAKEAGNHVALWDGTTAEGKPVAGGVYLYRFKAGNRMKTTRVPIY